MRYGTSQGRAHRACAERAGTARCVPRRIVASNLRVKTNLPTQAGVDLGKGVAGLSARSRNQSAESSTVVVMIGDPSHASTRGTQRCTLGDATPNDSNSAKARETPTSPCHSSKLAIVFQHASLVPVCRNSVRTRRMANSEAKNVVQG